MRRVALWGFLLSAGCYVDASGCKARLLDRNECSEANPSVEACEAKCEAGELDACVLAADALGEFQADRQQRNLETACDANHANACRQLGIRFSEAEHGFESDPKRAAALFERGCDLGDAGGCYSAGILAFREGLGTPDLAKARRYMAKGCELGSEFVCAMLGHMHEVGEGGPADRDAAVRLYRKACDADEIAGCHGLGSLIAREKLPGSKKEAKDLLARACKEDFDDSCDLLKKIE